MKMSDEKILVFSSREICYLSGNFFAHQIGAAFEELGYEVEICEVSEGDDLDAVLEPLTGRPYRLILDFNSMLPGLAMEDGQPYPDRLSGPFFNYVLDHPLFHYNSLTSAAENLHAIVPDEAQEAYVRAYYPQVKRVFTLPLAGTRSFTAQGREEASERELCGERAESTPAEADKCLMNRQADRQCRVFFPGTYDDPESVYRLVQEAPAPQRDAMKALTGMRLADPLLPMEEAFARYLQERDIRLTRGQFALSMNAMYPVDAYVRDYFRKAAVDALLSAGLPVTVMGEGWQKYHFPDERLLRRERGCSFALSFERIAREEILLNVSPIFSHGMHDRIPAGMANGTVVLTDENPYLARRFADGETIAFYSLKDIDTLAGKAALLMEDSGLRERIKRQAYREFCAHDTWKHRAEQILKMSDGLEGRDGTELSEKTG